MPNYYRENIGSDEQRRGRRIYHSALDDRLGFRADQIGIPEDDNVWLEIFGALGDAAASATKEGD